MNLGPTTGTRNVNSRPIRLATCFSSAIISVVKFRSQGSEGPELFPLLVLFVRVAVFAAVVVVVVVHLQLTLR